MPLYLIIIIASFFISIFGLVVVKEDRVPMLFCFSLFLLASAIVEYIGVTMSATNRNSVSLYNYFIHFELFFYLFCFRAVFTNPAIKRTILIAVSVYFAFTLVNVFFIQGMAVFMSYTYILGCLLIVTFSIIYFYLLFRFPETGSLIKNPFFWIASGLMFYYTCTLPLYGLQNSIIAKMPSYNRVLYLIGDFLNILLYTLFSIGFLCQINLQKSSRLS